MELVFALTLPFFAVAGLGLVAGRVRMIDDAGLRSLNIFVFYFCLPALVVDTLGRQPISTLLDVHFFFGWSIATVTLFILTALAGQWIFKATPGEMGVFGMSASVGNVGFLGLPLLLAAFGDVAAGPVAQVLAVDLIIMTPMTLGVLEGATGGGNRSAVAKRVALGVVVNPFIVAIILGLTVSAVGMGMPQPIDRFVSFLGAAAGPTALFALGVSLSGRRVEGDRSAILFMTVAKLIVMPLMVYGGLTLMGVPDPTRAIGVVIASLPIAGNLFVLAHTYKSAPRRASTAILLSTLFAVVTVAIAVTWADARI